MEQATMKFEDGKLYLIDQRKLPITVEYYKAGDYRAVKFAISDMVVRGAPAIGATGAYGIYLAAREYRDASKEKFLDKVKEAGEELGRARPTAVNLTWAIRRMKDLLENNSHKPVKELVELIKEEAEAIAEEDVEINKRMARHGNEIVPQGATILTHCNTGALATVGYGTALGVIREAHNSGKDIEVYADETRPRLQGARLTTFELIQEGISATLIVDSVAGTLIRNGEIDLVLVGADRVAANGDVANKIGTYTLSELTSRHDVPFYVVAPTSTIDLEANSGNSIEVEERDPEEVREIQGVQIAPDGVDVYNPAFDVSPAANVSGIITEKGIARPPFESTLKNLKE
ncbi:S-methyl-5-thioribose-1-phosphate isomerase [Candidatus Bipolaricaulota bacterium]|nr:S-methyl-5-thioribose-1-phosphate isomerase [Candidatus Bipolaricaulota bacterium]